MSQQIIKFNSGEEVICNVVKDVGDYISIENPMKMLTIPRATKRGIVESLTLSRWLYPYTEQKICKVRKDSITTIMSASEGLKTFYYRQLEQGEKQELKIHDWEARDYNELGEDFDEEEVKKYLEALEPLKSVKKKILH
jgi:hypothetical protein|tara:strand:- start:4925 stop:5341 length:417 start_codon:yes stop_codon:yes gene_type:complete